MYYNYNIPRSRRNMYQNHRGNYHNNERFFTGGFAVPFLLGGITGSLLTPRRPYYYPPYNNFNYYNNFYYPYPNYPYYY